MAGWDKEKVRQFKTAFADFLRYVVISSKETGVGPITLYNAQRRFLTEVFEGLENDIHFFVVLKARQLGISTIVRALIVFWAFMHEGLRVALIYDTDSNKNDARAEIKQFLEHLPESHRIPVKAHPQDHLELENGSRISYFVAGVKKSKGSGGLGRSRGINCLGATEVSSWADIEGLRALERSLAQKFENRLYIFESTARGFNIFYELWQDARADDLSKKAIFIGWWAKEDYAIPRGTALFDRYGTAPPDAEEEEKIRIVKERYGHDVTMEQLAWYRHEFDPNVESSDVERDGEEIILQELPWYEDESWIMSGSVFFPSERLSIATKEATQVPVKGYQYFMSDEFFATLCEPVSLIRRAHLKIWEEPDPSGLYVIGADPAFGSSDTGDRYCAQVLRCYADGIDQVAEFCWPSLSTYQFAWVIAHLCGAYKNARLLLELNGPGHAVWNAFRELDLLIKQGYLREEAQEMGVTNIFANVRNYLWARQDSLSRNPSAFHWETNTKRKIQILERLRDFFNRGEIRINSIDCLQEMQKIVRDGDSIAADGQAKDDRVIALALAVRAWEDSERRNLIVQQRTRINEERRRTMSQADLQQLFSEHIVGDFFRRQDRERKFRDRMARRGSRYNW